MSRLASQTRSAASRREPADEDTESCECEPLDLVQQIVAPLERGAKRPLTHRLVACAARQQREPLIEPLEDRIGREEADAGGGELDGEWQTIQASADQLDGCRVPAGRHEVRRGGERPIDEQRDRLIRRERADRIDVLGRDVERFATGDERSACRCSRDERGQQRSGLDDLLEVVDHEQHLLRGEERGQRLPGTLVDPECLRDRGNDEVRIGDAGQVDQVDAIGMLVKQVRGNLDRQACLARSAGARQGHEPNVTPAQQGAQLADLSLPSDERRRLGRQVRRAVIE